MTFDLWGLKALLEKEADLQVVGEAGTGPETLRAVEKIPADVLVLDISMPGMPGPQVAAASFAQNRVPGPSVSIARQSLPARRRRRRAPPRGSSASPTWAAT